MISKSIAERVLAEALTTGGDFAELFMEDTRQMGIMLMDGMIDSASTSRRHACTRSSSRSTCTPSTPARRA